MADGTPTTTSSPSPPSPNPQAAPSSSREQLIEDHLAQLGAESETARAVKRITPWIMSVAAHAAMVALAIIIAGTVILLEKEDEAVLIVADFDAMTYEPVAQLEREQIERFEREVQDRVPLETVEITLNDQVLDLEVDPVTVISSASSAAQPRRFDAQPGEATVEFVGLTSSNARRIIYVIDASGSMIRSLQIVLQELSRSLENLVPQQRFGIVFFQANRAIPVPPANDLTRATPDAKIASLEWIDKNIYPKLGSNPIEAMKYAMSLEPDVIFLLSENITGTGQYEVDQRELLALLDELNPKDPDTARRKTTINCIQFLDPDPLDTLRIIAREHGGPRGYKLLDRAELGMSGR